MSRAGDFDTRVTIQRNIKTTNDWNETVDSWSDVATVWASVEPSYGSRLYQAKQANSKVIGICRIRYRSDIEATMRLVIGSQIMYIETIIPKDNELHLHYKESLD